MLNKCHKFKSFVYGNARFAENEGKTVIEIEVKPKKNSKAICSGCQKPAPGYDSLEERKFEFIPIGGFSGFFCIHNETCAVPSMRGACRRSALGRRKAAPDEGIYAVFGPLGKETILEGGS